jgi:molybdate/tungstate transport system substrate-binding protein
MLPGLVFGLGGCKASRPGVVVFAAASLARALSDLKQTIESEQSVEIQLTVGGSQEACRKVAELGHQADVVATADYRVIDQILRPRHASFDIHFTTNEVVLAHLQHSKFTEEVTARNWASILERPGVHLGMASPDLAPIGYATLLVWQLAGQERGDGPGLASRLRARCAPEHLAADEGELLQLLQSRAIDYAFMYRSTAEEHNLKLVPLPDSINLGAPDKASVYAKARVQVRMKRAEGLKTIQGSPITYGLTIPTGAPNRAGAELFVRYLLGEAGQRTLRRTGFRPIVPASCEERGSLPAALQSLTR